LASLCSGLAGQNGGEIGDAKLHLRCLGFGLELGLDEGLHVIHRPVGIRSLDIGPDGGYRLVEHSGVSLYETLLSEVPVELRRFVGQLQRLLERGEGHQSEAPFFGV